MPQEVNYREAQMGLSQAAMGSMSPRQVTAFAQEEAAAMNRSSTQAHQSFTQTLSKTLDYKRSAEAQMNMKRHAIDARNELQQGLDAAPGTPKSFYYESGDIDQSKVEEFLTKYNDLYDSESPIITDPEMRAEFMRERDEAKMLLGAQLMGQVNLHEAKQVRRVGKAVLNEYAAAGDWTGYEREVERQRTAGICTAPEAREMQRRARAAATHKRGTSTRAPELAVPRKKQGAAHEEVEF